MIYKAKYIHKKKEQPDYYRTITSADTQNEAAKQAEKWVRKGFICVGVVSESR